MCPGKVDHCLVSEGWFWSASGGPRVRGEFVAETGRNAEARLDGAVVDDPRKTVEHTATSTSVTVSGDPAKIVAAFAPVDLHGQLDSGELVSLLSAQDHGLITPHYLVRVAVFGAHVFGDQLYSAVRFRIDAPYWTAHLAGGEAHTVPDDGSVLRAVAAEEDTDKGTWLVYESALPRSRRQLESRVVAGAWPWSGLPLTGRWPYGRSRSALTRTVSGYPCIARPTARQSPAPVSRYCPGRN